MDEDHCTVTCVRCETEYEGFSEDQAHDCAADIYEDGRIRGHYGSSQYDMTSLRFVSSHAMIEHGPIVPGVICDACITGLVDAGAVCVTSQMEF